MAHNLEIGMPKTRHLDRVKGSEELRRLSIKYPRKIAEELRTETVDAVSVTGGHLGAGLGVVKLTVIFHHVFDTPMHLLVGSRPRSMVPGGPAVRGCGADAVSPGRMDRLECASTRWRRTAAQSSRRRARQLATGSGSGAAGSGGRERPAWFRFPLQVAQSARPGTGSVLPHLGQRPRATRSAVRRRWCS